MSMDRFSGRLALQQRVLPSYRVPFFDLLAGRCEKGMTLFAGLARPAEMIADGKTHIAQFHQTENIHLFSGTFYFCYQKGISGWLENSNPDALIVEANPRYLSTPSAIKWMRKRGKKIIGWGLGAPKTNWGWRTFVNQFDAMISYSQRGAEEYARLGFPRGRIFVAHNSVSPAPENIDQRRRMEERPAILFVGRLQARKRVDHLLRACAEMESKPRLMIVGDGLERDSLISFAKEAYPAAEFIGAKHGAELDPYFAQADLFVLPGTGGLAVQEAMSHGLPVIVAKGDGTQDDLVRENNGWQIEPENYPALVAAMKNALAEPARLKRMGKESFRIVKEEINIERMADAFVNVLNSPRR